MLFTVHMCLVLLVVQLKCPNENITAGIIKDELYGD